MDFDDFFEQKGNSKYRKLQNMKGFKQAYDIMTTPEKLYRMFIAIENERPPLEAVLDEIEELNCDNFDIRNYKFLRQAIGALVKYVISFFGYEVTNKRKSLPRRHIITSATCYKLNTDKATKQLVREFVVKPI